MLVVTNIRTGATLQLNIPVDSLLPQDAGAREAAEVAFSLEDPNLTFDLKAEDEITITKVEDSGLLFGGNVRELDTVANAHGRTFHIVAYDYSTLLDRVNVVSDDRVAGESDKARLTYFMTTYGPSAGLSPDASGIATLNTSMPAQKFRALTLRQAIELVLGSALETGTYRLNASKKLDTWDTTGGLAAAPYDVVVGTPAAGQIAPESLSVKASTSNLYNAYWVRGATAAGSGWFTDAASIATWGRREKFIDAPDSDLSWKAYNVGHAALADTAQPAYRGTFQTQDPASGWRSNQRFHLTSPAHGLTNAPFDVARVTRAYLTGQGLQVYNIEFGSPKRSFAARTGRNARRSTGTGPGSDTSNGPGGTDGTRPATGGGAECFDCPDAPWTCIPVDLSVPWNGGIDRAGGMMQITDPTFEGQQHATTVSTPGGGGYITCYAGTTYRVSVSGWPMVLATDTFDAAYGYKCPTVPPAPGVVIYPWAVVRNGVTRLSCHLTEADADARAAALGSFSRPADSDPYPPGSYPRKWGWINSVGIGHPSALPGISFNMGWYPNTGDEAPDLPKSFASGLWTCTYTSDTYYGHLGCVNDVNHNSYLFASTIDVSYVSGTTDPRFVTIPTCANGEPTINQTVQEPTALGNGTTTQYTTSYPYTPLSLRVVVNGLDWTAELIEFNPATGAYTLLVPPPAGSLVRVTYRRAS